MATFSQNTKTQNYTAAQLQSSQTPTGNKRIPTSGSGLSTRGVILNDPALEQCVVGPARIDYQVITKIALGGSKGDVQVQFSFPVRKIWIASKDHSHLSDSLYFHFSPLRKTYTGNAIDPVGTEQWFDMTYTPAGGTIVFGKFLEFENPFTTGFFDIGQEAGGGDY